ncbi:MAG TPA: hypothetical protein VJT75_16415 [Thermoleophilaceae bacterium]|nr:hypothetical protein [Thermoleophilaceae bacterium]
MPARTFVVTVSDSPARVLVEDVRTQERAVADDLAQVGARIAEWLEPEGQPPPTAAAAPR